MKYIFFLSLILLFTGCREKNQHEMIITNAKIYSVNKDFDIYQAMAVKDGRVVAMGSDEEISARYTDAQVIDLGGKPVYPGFIDPHCHFYGYGTTLSEADLFGTTSFEEILGLLEEFADEHSEGWITGMGWDQNDWEVKEFPEKSQLDSMFPDRPVLLRRIDGHAALANQAAMDKAEITAETIIEGGEVVKMNGKPTGILIDNAIELVSRKIPAPGPEKITESLMSSQEKCFAVGLTSVHDAGLEKNIIKTIDSLQQAGELKMRVYAMLSPTEENFEEFMYKGIYKTDRLHVASVKLFADGALGSRGALLLEPYSDAPDQKGLALVSPEYIEKTARLADSCGYQVNTHCIGDGANRMVLDIYGKVLGGKNDKRWRIEHAQIVNQQDVDKFGEFSIIPSIQTTHATSDMYWADERLGERIRDSYIFKTLLKENGWLPNGSDFPIEDINPLYGFYAAVSRKDQEGYPENGFQPEEALSREEALRAMTIWAAKAGFEEEEIGSLESGKKADFVVLEKDLMTAEEEELFSIKVLETWSGGEKVYSAK